MNTILTTTKHVVTTLKARLTTTEESKPLSSTLIVILLILDICLLSALFKGLHQHSSQLTTPEQYFPSSFRNIIIEQQWDTPEFHVEAITNVVMKSQFQYKKKLDRTYKMHPLCETLESQIDAIKSDSQLQILAEARRKAIYHQRGLQQDIQSLQSNYNTELVEHIAGVNKSKAPSEIAGTIANKTERINQLEKEIKRLNKALLDNEKVTTLISSAQSLSKADRQELISEIQHKSFWYPVILMGYQFIFLLPLFGVSFVIHTLAFRKKKYTLSLITAHLLCIVSIPIIIRVIDVLTTLIPDRLLVNFLLLLKKLHIIALWHYFVIFLFVIIGVYLIKKVRAYEANKAVELTPKRITGHCHSCAQGLPSLTTPHCPYCGATQLSDCPSCEKPTYVYTPHCHECGVETGLSL